MLKINLLFVLIFTSLSTADIDPILVQHWLNVMIEYRSKCACATGVDPAVEQRYMYELDYPNNACLHCFVKCLYLSANFVNADGSFKLKEFIRVFPEAKVFGEKCYNETNSELDPCLKIFNIDKCFVRELGGFS